MSDTLKDELREIITEVTEVEDIPGDTPFADLGIDSMMAIEIVADVEKNYEITISEDELADLTNLDAVYGKVKDKLAEKG
jgi:acyl carrier protein